MLDSSFVLQICGDFKEIQYRFTGYMPIYLFTHVSAAPVAVTRRQRVRSRWSLPRPPPPTLRRLRRRARASVFLAGRGRARRPQRHDDL